MIIPLVNREPINTNNINDVDAELLEKFKELSDLCIKYNRQYFFVIDARDKNVQNNTDYTVSVYPKKSPNLNLNDIICAVNGGIHYWSNGNFQIIKTNNI